MRADEYKVMAMAVEDGVTYGYMRAHKHQDDPTEHTIKQAIGVAVVNSLCEWFEFRPYGGECQVDYFTGSCDTSLEAKR